MEIFQFMVCTRCVCMCMDTTNQWPLQSCLIHNAFIFCPCIDFRDFSSSQIMIHPPKNFLPTNALFVDVLGGKTFEPEEQIVVSFGSPKLIVVQKPFMSDESVSPPNSIIMPPDVDRIIFDLPSTKIIIKGGNLNFQI